jgi:ATP-dependent RNA helicase RhlE
VPLLPSADRSKSASFSDLHLPEPILRAVRAVGYTKPTPIQLRAIPIIMEGHDVVAAAQTGSG